MVLIPTSALTGLTVTQLEAVIAHELAHVRRHDYLVNGLQSLAETLLFYHPAVWWISARVRQEREHCCDDVAIAVCGDPVTYGRALASLEQLRQGEGLLAVAASDGSLTERIRRLLGAPVQRPRRSLSVVATLVGASTLGLLAASPPEPPPLPPTPPVPATPSESELAPVPPAPPLPPALPGDEHPPVPPEMPAPTVDSPPVPPAPPAPPTGARTPPVVPPLPPAPRPPDLSPLGADQGQLRQEYLTDLLSRLPAASDEAAALLADAPRLIQSDAWLGLLLRQQTSHVASAGPARDAYFAAAGSIASDHELRLVLTELASNGPLTPDLFQAVLHTAGGVDDDEERARLLTDLVEMQRLDARTRPTFFSLANDVTSNSERASVLIATANRDRSPDTLARVLASTVGLNSDAHKHRVLERVLAASAAPALREPFFRAVSTLHSDHERRRALEAVANLTSPSDTMLLTLFETASDIGSDYELASLLVRTAERHPLDTRLRPAYHLAVATLDSTLERRRALAALDSH